MLHRRAGDVMTRTPVTMARELRLADALHLMETRRITSVPVVDDQGRVEGVLHIHDLWRRGARERRAARRARACVDACGCCCSTWTAC